MKTLITITLLALATTTQAQQLSFSPTSAKMWGTAPATIKATASYHDFEAVLLHGAKRMYDRKGAMYGGTYFGLFYTPINLEWKDFEVEGGAGYFFRKFPTINGTNVNFTAKLTYNITERLGVRYAHLSNGFGLVNPINPGLDNLSIVITLN